MLTCKQERLADVLPEVEELWKEHWAETEGYRHVLGYNPDKEGFLKLDAAGMFRLYTARVHGVLVGQFGLLVYPSRHTQTRTASEDFFYVRKEFRGAGVASQLMRFGLMDLRDEGVEQVTFSDKEPSDLSSFLAKFGFKQVAKQYSLIFKEV